MLVLTRKVNETIIIDNCIRVTLVSINGPNVRLGIEAPADIRVDREEVHRRLREFLARDEVAPTAVVAASPREHADVTSP